MSEYYCKDLDINKIKEIEKISSRDFKYGLMEGHACFTELPRYINYKNNGLNSGIWYFIRDNGIVNCLVSFLNETGKVKVEIALDFTETTNNWGGSATSNYKLLKIYVSDEYLPIARYVLYYMSLVILRYGSLEETRWDERDLIFIKTQGTAMFLIKNSNVLYIHSLTTSSRILTSDQLNFLFSPEDMNELFSVPQIGEGQSSYIIDLGQTLGQTAITNLIRDKLSGEYEIKSPNYEDYEVYEEDEEDEVIDNVDYEDDEEDEDYEEWDGFK